LTNACFSTLTCAVPLRILETVLGETPARSATIVSVALAARGAMCFGFLTDAAIESVFLGIIWFNV
jgi:hypothetical protein